MQIASFPTFFGGKKKSTTAAAHDKHGKDKAGQAFLVIQRTLKH